MIQLEAHRDSLSQILTGGLSKYPTASGSIELPCILNYSNASVEKRCIGPQVKDEWKIKFSTT